MTSSATAAGLAVLVPLPDRLQTPLGAWCVLLTAVIYLTWGTARGADAPQLAARQAHRPR